MNALKSKTMWFSALTVLAGVVDQVTPFIPADKQGAVVAGIGVLTGILRMVTNKPLNEK